MFKSKKTVRSKLFTLSKTLILQASPGSNPNNDPGADLDVLDQVETEEPKDYKVLLLNDDFTPMDFVIYVLKSFFGHDENSAQKIMLDVHKMGSGVAGIYNFEVAESKSLQVNQFSKSNKYPLKSIIEEET